MIDFEKWFEILEYEGCLPLAFLATTSLDTGPNPAQELFHELLLKLGVEAADSKVVLVNGEVDRDYHIAHDKSCVQPKAI